MTEVMEDRTCECGAQFRVKPGSRRVTCGRAACRKRRKRALRGLSDRPAVCEICGKSFIARGNRSSVTCGKEKCQQENRRRRQAARYREQRDVSATAVQRRCRECLKRFWTEADGDTWVCPKCLERDVAIVPAAPFVGPWGEIGASLPVGVSSWNDAAMTPFM